MSDVFISYAREDRDKAESLARAFEEQNWTIWWDKVIPPGRKYADVIGEELASAKAVIVLWSQASVASDWVKDEAQEGSNRRVLIPVLVEKVTPPYGFRQLQTADLSDWDGSSSHGEVQSLVRSIGGLINKPVTAVPLSSDRPDAGKRRLLLLLLAGAVLIPLLAYGAYRLIPKGTDPNQNQRAGGDGGSNNQNKSGTTPCNSEARKKAVNSTSDGLVMIDPRSNYNAAVLNFGEAITECPDYAPAYYWRGTSHVALQDNKNALLDFRKVVEISTDPDMRQKAQKFISEIEGSQPTPSPGTVNTNANPDTNANINTGDPNVNGNTTNTNQSSTRDVQAQVKKMFADEKSTRIDALSLVILEKKQHPKAVALSVESALEHPEHKSGVINTLVFLEKVDPEILKKNRKVIEKLFAVAKDNGPETAEHIKKVESLLNQ